MYMDENEEYKSKYENLLAYVEELEAKKKNSEPDKGKEKLDPIEQRLFALDEALEKLFIGKERVDFKNRLIFAKEYANSLKIKILQ